TLHPSGSDAYELALVAQDGRRASLRRRALAQVSVSGATAPKHIVPELVSLLFFDPERVQPHVAASPPPRDAHPDRPPGQRAVNGAGWSSLAAGGALLSAGIAVGIASRDD